MLHLQALDAQAASHKALLKEQASRIEQFDAERQSQAAAQQKKCETLEQRLKAAEQLVSDI